MNNKNVLKNLKEKIIPEKLPVHIAIIMDGNGRWAKKRGLPREEGHRQGVKRVREIVEASVKVGIKYLTLYSFSTENWKRPKTEINALMRLLNYQLKRELKTMLKNKIKFRVIGDITAFPKYIQKNIQKAIEETKHFENFNLILALNYGSRREITRAVKLIVNDFKEGKINIDNINEELISKYLWTKDIPDPDLLIRTSGEYRLSNFLLWQCAYTELYITPVLWPDFNEIELLKAILDYQRRERRFGGIIENSR